MTDSHLYKALVDAAGHLNDEGVAWYAEHLFHDNLIGLPAELLSHVSDCETCKASCLAVAEIISLTEKSEKGEEDTEQEGHDLVGEAWPAYRKKKPVHLFLKVAAVIIFLAGVGGIIYKYNSHMNATQNVEMAEAPGSNPGDSLGEEIQAGLFRKSLALWKSMAPGYESSFHPEVKMESMLRMVFRSHSFRVQHPDTMSLLTVGMPINFIWVQTSPERLTLRLINNEGKLMHKRSLDHHNTYSVRKLLPPGLYYWFFENDHQTIAGGRMGVVPDQ